MNALLAAGLAASLKFFASTNDPTDVTVRAVPAPDGSTLSLHLQRAKATGPAMFADVSPIPGGLELKPSFRLEPGGTYLARLLAPGGVVVERVHRVPNAGPAPTPRVVQVWPQAGQLPANLLKFYIGFSEPMREGREIFDLIHLLDDQGRKVDAPWRRQELWSEDARRLSLWIHPGRVKRGVNLRESMGPVLAPYRRYRLVLDARIRSAAGASMGTEFVHEFNTTAEDHVIPSPKAWQLHPPARGTRGSLRVESTEPLDHALLARCQWVEDASGRRISGGIVVQPTATAWEWMPDEPWSAGEYRLCVNEWLEDLAGNTPARPFERDVDAPEPVFETVRLSFQVR